MPFSLIASRLLTALVCGWLASCSLTAPAEQNLCPNDIQTEVSPVAGGITWGRSTPPVGSAKLGEIRIECLKVQNPAIETPQIKRGAFTDYQIAVSAEVSYEISASAKYVPTSTLVSFEALSDSKVVLRSGNGLFQPVRNGTLGLVSGRITNLSDDEIKRVKFVRVGWVYK